MQYEAAIFDLDGTLINSIDDNEKRNILMDILSRYI